MVFHFEAKIFIYFKSQTNTTKIKTEFFVKKYFFIQKNPKQPGPIYPKRFQH